MKWLIALIAFVAVVPFASHGLEEVSWPDIRDTYWGFRVALGQVPGVATVNKFGRTGDIDAADGFEEVWDGTGPYSGFADAAEIIEVFSGDADDTLLGNGARTLQIQGLDANYNELNETLAMDGAGAVDSTGAFLRVFRAEVLTVGDTGENEGSITIRQSVTTANVFIVIQPGYNQSMVALYTVPAGKTAYLTSWFCSLTGTTVADAICRIQWREFGSAFQVKEEVSIRAAGSSAIPRPFPIPKGPVPAKADIKIMTSVGAANTAISATFDLILVDE